MQQFQIPGHPGKLLGHVHCRPWCGSVYVPIPFNKASDECMPLWILAAMLLYMYLYITELALALALALTLAKL